jgi:hypothetical protein
MSQVSVDSIDVQRQLNVPTEIENKSNHPQIDSASSPHTAVPNDDDSDPESGNPYIKHHQASAAIWSLYLTETEAEDKELADLWQVGLDQLLIFVRPVLSFRAVNNIGIL